ncbi:multiple sugar transport system substrate-binding protein [Streptomyces sp. V4I23]|uniref:ABC transporter substrate-binding protein n=1 Tax=Streptomyces sp. V4I23 TaxID=3042282 RepID=UPI0027859787|nr:sugar ABC transporter substrate-binding protein [Streptomyces sp. V4I23]MDQ1012058.1 multiple sugar transport system substrate-binding protein [Streptomyces sp. V4I23]
MNKWSPAPGAAGLPRRNVLKLGGLAGLGLLTATGCGAGGAADDSSGGSGSLRVLCEAGGKQELLKIAELFKKKTGTSVTFVELPYDGLFNRLLGEFSSGAVSFDVAALDAIWLPAFAEGVLRPLDDLFTEAVKKDLFPSLVQGAQVKGRYLGMPAWTNSEILFYRKDLFEDSKEQAAFEKKYGYPLAPPTNWDQFTDAAEFFTRDTKGKNALYGTDVKGAVETEWLTHVLQAGSPGAVLDDQGKVIIDNRQHLDALRFYSGLSTKAKVAPPGAKQLDWGGAQNLFNQGRTAMMRFWAHAFPLVPTDSPVHGKVGAAPMIAGAAGIAGVPGPWYLSVPQATKKADLATEFVQFCYDNNALGIQSSLGLAARVSAFEEYQDKPGHEHFKPLVQTLSSPATRSRPATPKWQQIVDTVLIPTIQKSLTPGADYEALLKGARSDVERLVG